MARRRKNEDLATILVLLPWRVSVATGLLGFVAIRWLLPLFFSGSPVLASLAVAFKPLAWLALVFFGALGVVAAFHRGWAFEQDPHVI